MTAEDYLNIIDSLLHCMSDMDKGIGCDGCKSNIGGACDLDHLLALLEVEQMRRVIETKARGEDA